MKVKSLEIKKFRSIDSCIIELDKVNAIVGENNSGKTAILRALNAFFNFKEEEMSFLNESHRFKSRTNTYIAVTFKNVPNNTEFDKYKNKNDAMKIEFVYEYSNRRFRYRYKCDVDGKNKNLPDVFIEKIRKYIEYIYIPAGRTNADLDWSEESIFSRLILEYTNQLTSKRDNVSKNIQSAGKNFQDSILNKIEKKLNDLYMIESNKKIKIDYSKEINYSIFLELLRLKVIEYDKTLDIIEHGSGTTSLSIITMYRALAQILDCNIYLGIEEPETNLHPQAQKKLVYSLNNYREDNEVQTIFTTHSTVMVDELTHDQIILIRRIKDRSRGFKSDISQLKKEFWDDDEIKNMKLLQFFKVRNSDFFFSKHVIIFESTTDAQMFEKILVKKTKNRLYDINFFSLNGVDSIIYPIKLFKALNIPYSVVVDKDFFTDYVTGEKKDSIDEQGFYKYSDVLKNSNKNVIKLMINDENIVDDLNGLLKESYTKLFNYLENHNIYSMKYCLEQDMMESSVFRNMCYEKFNIESAEQSTSKVLVENASAIKKAIFLLDSLDEMEIKDYPYSIKKISNSLIKDINIVLE